MEVAADRCSNDAMFLAALGGAWLEVGDARQALLRLERALLLNPDLLAAQADHALALAALGEPAAREELVRAWQGRSDVPPVLWKRLNDPAPLLAKAAAGAGQGAATSPARGWVQWREVQLLTGYENNLAQSPRLDELTITPPDGPITLPLARALEPRAGGAVLLDVTWQGIFSPSATRSYLVGVQASARHAPGESDTDWQSVRLGLGSYQSIGAWRWQIQGQAQLAGGELAEGRRTWQAGNRLRMSLGAEGPAGTCSQRWYLEAEARRYREFPINDGQVSGVAASLLCVLPGLRAWTLGLSAAWGQDRARSDQRPGGDQQKSGLGLRLLADFGRNGRGAAAWSLDAQWRYSNTRDEEGYSPLLENNARRDTKTTLFSLELTAPWFESTSDRAESVIQVLTSRENSNLPIFSFSTASIYAGVRYKW